MAVSAGSRSLANFAAKLQKDHGEKQVPLKAPPLVVVPTGSATLDWALRIGGFLLGRLYEIIGVKDAGKSTLVLTAAGIYQQRFPERGVAYVDVEGTIDYDWATALGVDCSDKAAKAGRWLHLEPKDSETASAMAAECARSGLVSLIIIDSIGGMESRKVLDHDEANPKKNPSTMSNSQVITRMSKRLATLARDHRVTILLVNQYRANTANPMGSDVSAGPKTMQHATTAKIEMSQVFADGSQRKSKFWGDEEVVGNMSRARVTRLKQGARSRVAEFFIMTQETDEFGGVGIDSADEYLRLGIKVGVIKKDAGGYYTVPGIDGRVHGEEKVLKALRDDPDMLKAIHAEIPFDTPANDELEEANA
jgi:recombination protein RecA